jgi:protocatechuate 4,5-dioxygenase alpha chain
MSRYAVNKALWQVARDQAACAAFRADRDAFLAGWDLTEQERADLTNMDYRALFEGGAHPFLLYTSRIRLSDGWTFQLMLDHIAAFEGVSPPLDIST